MSFPESFHSKAYACIHVFEHTRPVLLVSRGEGDWSFLCGDLHPSDSSFYKVVGIGHILAQDPTLASLKDLPSDWEAERAAEGGEWVRAPIPVNE